MPGSAVPFLLALGLGTLAGHASTGGLPAETLLADDECWGVAGEGPQCGLRAVQLRTRKGPAGPEVSNSTESSSTEEPEQTVVRILHLSDTHNLHRDIENEFPFPPADILIHSGDFTNYGKSEEFADVNQWLGEIRPRFKHILWITGNHDWIENVKYRAAYNKSFWRERISNAQLLMSEEVNIMGLKIFGSPWKGFMSHSSPHGFGKIPSGLDILVTHGPPLGILDWCGSMRWGSSDELTEDVREVKPKVHLFGHDHEQRGYWKRDSVHEPWHGGVEYMVNISSGKPFPTTPPPDDYPPQLISNNAMMNHPGHEGWSDPRIAGPARLIIATNVDGEWRFSTNEIEGLSTSLSGNVDAGIS